MKYMQNSVRCRVVQVAARIGGIYSYSYTAWTVFKVNQVVIEFGFETCKFLGSNSSCGYSLPAVLKQFFLSFRQLKCKAWCNY